MEEIVKLLKQKHKEHNKAYREQIELYRDLNKQQDEVRAKKVELRGVGEKLYALKKKETLTEEDKTFIESLDYSKPEVVEEPMMEEEISEVDEVAEDSEEVKEEQQE